VTRDHIDLHLPTSYVPPVLSEFERHSIELTIPARSTPPYGSSSWNVTQLGSEFHSEYHRLEEIRSFINELSETYPRLVEVVRIGQSSEGREIIGVKIEEASCFLPQLLYLGWLPLHTARIKKSASEDCCTRCSARTRRESGASHANNHANITFSVGRYIICPIFCPCPCCTKLPIWFCQRTVGTFRE
jgi:Zinc carboxypeptidase